MATRNYDAADLEGRAVYSNDGEKLGKVDDIVTDASGMPVYLEITTGWFGTSRHLIPVGGVRWLDDDLEVPYSKEQLEGAPTYGGSEDVDYERERTLGDYYGHDVREWDDEQDLGCVDDLTEGPTPETRRVMRLTRWSRRGKQRV
jgi:sporulation protein YlmC with PRC-barrel domain